MERHVPDYGFTVVPASFRKRLIPNVLAAVLSIAFLLLVGVIAFQPLPPPPPPAPAPGVVPAPATSAAALP